MIKRCLFNYN